MNLKLIKIISITLLLIIAITSSDNINNVDVEEDIIDIYSEDNEYLRWLEKARLVSFI